MPLYQRLPKRGFNNINAKTYSVVNVGLIQKFIDEGKIDPKNDLTEDALIASGLIRRLKDGIRVLAKGEITSKITLVVHGASKGAIEAIEKAGGSVTVTAKPKAGTEAA
jgi:large subunit ribosomal protein L15